MENFKTFVKKAFEYRKFILWRTRTLYKQRVFLPFLRTQSKIKARVAKPQGPYNLVIIDDFLPNILSAFRANEFAYLLKHIEGSALFSTIATKIHSYKPHYDYYIQSTSHFEKYRDEYSKAYDVNPQQILPFYTWTKINARLAYVVFLTNAFYLVEYFEQNGIKFILELYPGGGFGMAPEVHEKLSRVLSSPMLAKVFVTQKPSYQYLLDNKYCDPDKIIFKYGGILPPTFMNIPPKEIKYPHHKKTIDVCFTAAKYMEKGYDKGYDLFIEAAHMLLHRDKKYHFHIVGTFTEHDIEIDPVFRDHFHFYGLLKTPEFRPFYEDKDIFISPNRPFTLAKGAFDGYPTTAAGEAGLNNLCMVASDALDQNVIFTDGVDIVVVKNDAADICEKVMNLVNDPAKMYEIGEAGKHTIISDGKTQLPFRSNLINSILND